MRARCSSWPGLFFLAIFPVIVRAQTAASPPPAVLSQMMVQQPPAEIPTTVNATAAFDPPEVRPGEKSVYRVMIEATVDATKWPEEIPAPPELKLHRSASGQNMRQLGNVLQTLATFDFDAHVTEPGRFTVPEFVVQAYGKPVAVPAATLEVRADLPATHEPVRQLIVELETTNVFVGQAVGVNVLLPSSAENRIEGVSQVQLNGDGFIAEPFARGQAIRSIERNGRRVPTYVYQTGITPMAAGKLSISAQGFVSRMPPGGSLAISGPGMLAAGQPRLILLDSEPATLNVQPLPSENELPGFSGAVGSFGCEPPVLSTNVVKIGEPFQLSFFVTGQPDLNRLNPPPPPRVRDWQIFRASRGGIGPKPGTAVMAAKFTFTLIATTSEVHETPAIPFSYFDPDGGKYVDISIPPVPVKVLPGDAASIADVAMIGGENDDGTPLKLTLSKLATTRGRTARSLIPPQMRAACVLAQLVPSLALCGLWLWDRRRRFLEKHPEIVRRNLARRGLRRERRRIAQAAANGDAPAFLRSAVSALQIAAAPHHPAEPRALVCGDVLEVLSSSEREGPFGETVRKFFAAADAISFAVGSENRRDLLAENKSLNELLLKLEARL